MAVASAAASSSDGATTPGAVLGSDASAAKAGCSGLMVGPDGAFASTAKSTAVKTTVERVIFDFRFPGTSRGRRDPPRRWWSCGDVFGRLGASACLRAGLLAVCMLEREGRALPRACGVAA